MGLLYDCYPMKTEVEPSAWQKTLEFYNKIGLNTKITMQPLKEMIFDNWLDR